MVILFIRTNFYVKKYALKINLTSMDFSLLKSA